MDAEQRRLDRERVGGDVHAGAKHLRARLRSGTLDPARLRLAAHVGDPRARQVLADEAPPLELDLARWLAGLGDAEAAARAVVALARLAIPAWERVFPEVPVVRDAVDSAQAVLDSGPQALTHDMRANAAAASAASEFVRTLTAFMSEAAEAGCSPLDAREPAIAWLEGQAALTPALVSLDLSAEQAVDRLRRECAGPQGEASVRGVIGFAFQRSLSACTLAVQACAEVQRLSAAHESPELAEGFALTAHQNAGTYARQAARSLGTSVVRDAVREALTAWALRDNAG